MSTESFLRQDGDKREERTRGTREWLDLSRISETADAQGDGRIERGKRKADCNGSGENPEGKALSSRSRVHSLPSLDFPGLLLFPSSSLPPPPFHTRLVYFGLAGNILTISFSSRYPSCDKNYTSRLCSSRTRTARKLPLFCVSRDINHRGNKIFSPKCAHCERPSPRCAIATRRERVVRPPTRISRSCPKICLSCQTSRRFQRRRRKEC